MITKSVAEKPFMMIPTIWCEQRKESIYPESGHSTVSLFTGFRTLVHFLDFGIYWGNTSAGLCIVATKKINCGSEKEYFENEKKKLLRSWIETVKILLKKRDH